MSIITSSITAAVLHPSYDDTIFSTRSKSSKSTKQKMAHYELPPINYGLGNHYYHYGWPYTLEMLKLILRRLEMPIPNNLDRLPPILRPYLMQATRFGGIEYAWCQPDEWCESKNMVYTCEEGGEKRRFVTFYSIGCTYSKERFYYRPTQEGLDYLIKVFGERPRWLKDYATKEEYKRMLDD